jgi:hypothetical protein
MVERGNNEGIQIFGGTFNSEQTVVGRGANAVKTVHTTVGQPGVSQQREPVIPVLLVTANPRDTERIYVSQEERAIQKAIQQSRNRGQIGLDICPSATIQDLRQALLEKPYQIVHIAGHGLPEGIELADEQGYSRVVRAQALAGLFRAYAQTLRCVILNACYSIKPGQQISLGIRHTIAMEGTLHDDAAIEFARGFYEALGAGKEIEFAYAEGCRAVSLALPHTEFTSRLFSANY